MPTQKLNPIKVMNAVIRRIWGLILALAIPLSANAAITGSVKTIGGYGAGFRDGNNLVSQFRIPMGLAVTSSGRVLVADFGNNRIRIVDPVDEVTSTFATGLSGPAALAIDGQNRVYVVNFNDGTVVRFDSTGANPTIVASGLFNPSAIALDGSGNIYVAESTGLIQRFSSTGVPNKTYTVGVGAPNPPNIRGMAFVSEGEFVVSDAGNHVLWKLTVAGGAPFHYAGTIGVAGFADGGTSVGKFSSPQQIGVTTNGIVVVADRFNHRLRAVNSAGEITTIAGVDPVSWLGQDPSVLPGWTDDAAAVAEMREPVGIAVSQNGTVYDTEVFYHLVREFSGLSYPTNAIIGGGGTTTPPPPTGGAGNRISLGFASGEASSEFVGAGGQHFIAPVTLTIVPGTKIYGMQFNLIITNTPGSPAGGGGDPYLPDFTTGFRMPDPGDPRVLIPIDPKMYIGGSLSTNLVGIPVNTPLGIVTNFVLIVVKNSQFEPLVIGNGVGNFLGIGWLERFGETNLYPTPQQDLIMLSQAHDTVFSSAGGKIIVGAFGFDVPDSARDGHQYIATVGRPSANGDGVASDVPISAPDGSDPSIPVAAVRTLNIASRPYLVGDVAPFRWFNAGDFGDNNILNNDLEQLHQTVAYGYNAPPDKSDMLDALDSCCRSADGAINYSDPASFISLSGTNLNLIGKGDGVLNLSDIYVTFRRSLDPSLWNYVRFWTNGALMAVSTTNSFRGIPGADGGMELKTVKKPALDLARMEEPVTATFSADSVLGQPGQTLRVPIRLKVTGPLAARSLVIKIRVLGLDGFSSDPGAVSFTPWGSLGTPLVGTGASNVFSGLWFELGSGYAAGSYQLGTLNIPIPANANPDTVFGVQFDKAELSAGITQFPVTTQTGYILMPNRATEPWNDEIPDAWRIQYFGSLMNILSAPNADADGDGLTTLQEYHAGTNPNDTASLLAISGKAGLASIILNWPGASGKTYKLESSPTLVNPTWTTVEQGIAGNGGELQRTRPLDSSSRFFRVIAE